MIQIKHVKVTSKAADCSKYMCAMIWNIINEANIHLNAIFSTENMHINSYFDKNIKEEVARTIKEYKY